MAVIPGHIRDEVVVVGNHRDGKATLACMALPDQLVSYF